jgi:hypothetical protein
MGEQMFVMKSEVVGRLSVVSDLAQSVIKKNVLKMACHSFRTFV